MLIPPFCPFLHDCADFVIINGQPMQDGGRWKA